MEELTASYKQFLEELKKGCVFDSDSITEIDLLIKDLDSSKKLDEKAVQSFIHFFDSLVAKVKKGVNDWEGMCKVMIKKGSTKASRLFFMNSHSATSDLTLNVGLIAHEQSPYNSRQIRNFVYMNYVQACATLLNDPTVQLSEATRSNYATICKLFEEDEEDPKQDNDTTNGGGGIPNLEDFMKNPSGLVNMYMTMLDKLCASGLDGHQLCKMVLDNNNPIVTALIGSAFGDMLDIASVREQIEKLDTEDIKEILEHIKTRLKDLDLKALIRSVQNMDPSDLQKTVSGLQETFLSSKT